LPGHHGRLHTPIRLQLPAGLGLEPNGRAARSHTPFRPHVIPQDRDPAPIPLALQLAEEHYRIPDPLAEQLIDHRAIRVEPAASPAAPQRRRPAPAERPPDRAGVDPQLLGDVAEVDTP